MVKRFLVEDIETGQVGTWTLEQILRWVNSDTTCTDPDGNVILDGGELVMAGSGDDTLDHENCFLPYTANDWADGWYEWQGETEYCIKGPVYKKDDS